MSKENNSEENTPAPISNEQQAIKDKGKENLQKQPPPQELPADNVEEHPQRQLG